MNNKQSNQQINKVATRLSSTNKNRVDDNYSSGYERTTFMEPFVNLFKTTRVLSPFLSQFNPIHTS